MTNDLDYNKRIAREFYDLSFNQRKPEEAIQKYVGSYYRQHNPLAGDGPDAFIGFVKYFSGKYPEFRVNFKRFIAEGDMVAAHVHMIRYAGDRGQAIVDLFRIEDGKIVEHWDAIQDVPEKAENDNTMF